MSGYSTAPWIVCGAHHSRMEQSGGCCSWCSLTNFVPLEGGCPTGQPLAVWALGWAVCISPLRDTPLAATRQLTLGGYAEQPTRPDGNDRRCFCVLSQDICLLQTDGQSEVLTGLWEAVHQWLEFLLGVGRNCCVISKQHALMRTLRTFVLALRRTRLESLPSDRARR